jgi:cytochrome c peroxidase
MKKYYSVVLFAVALVILSFQLWRQHPARRTELSSPAQAAVTEYSNEPIEPLPLHVSLDQRKVRLGELLFNEPALSHDNTISCASCHQLNKGGADGLAHSIGIGGAPSDINAPSVMNAAFNFKQFWDGRAGTLEEQVDGPTNHPKEMGSSWPEIIRKLSESSQYSSEFAGIYRDGISQNNVKDAIATFERSLITPNSPFDRYLRGQKNALTVEELNGYRLFKEYGCTSCHQGTNVGGNLFERFGAMKDYFAARGHTNKADLGRFNVTGDEKDKYVFKVPSLRNVALTGPYFHDGSAKTLEDAVKIMSTYQLGRSLTASDTKDIVKFLKTLTGEYKGKAL